MKFIISLFFLSSSLISYSQYVNDYPLDSIKISSWQDGQWQPGNVQTFTCLEENKIQKVTHVFGGQYGPEQIYIEEFLFDENGNNIQTDFGTKDLNTDDITYNHRTFYEFDNLNQVLSDTRQVLSSNEWTNSTKLEYIDYDEYGNYNLFINSRFDEEWVVQGTESYNRNYVNGLEDSTHIERTWNGVLYEKSNYTYLYDENGLLIQKNEETMDQNDTDFANRNVILYEYDSEQKLILLEYMKVIGTIDSPVSSPFSRTFYEYEFPDLPKSKTIHQRIEFDEFANTTLGEWFYKSDLSNNIEVNLDANIIISNAGPEQIGISVYNIDPTDHYMLSIISNSGTLVKHKTITNQPETYLNYTLDQGNYYFILKNSKGQRLVKKFMSF